jgi:hypothetical protein
VLALQEQCAEDTHSWGEMSGSTPEKRGQERSQEHRIMRWLVRMGKWRPCPEAERVSKCDFILASQYSPVWDLEMTFDKNNIKKSTVSRKASHISPELESSGI